MKSFTKAISEGRCQGYGPDYVPFVKVREYHGYGSATAVWDPYEGRLVHCLSQAELNVYYMIFWSDNVKHIREQYLLDTDKMNIIAKELKFRQAPFWTTDFLVDYDDGSQTAFSVKADPQIFNQDNRIYRGRESDFIHLVLRQRAEQLYWESQGVRFKLVTNADVNKTLVANVKGVMSYYNDIKCINTQQKLKYLIAHRDVRVPMDRKILDYQELVTKAGFDIDQMFSDVIKARSLMNEMIGRR